MSGTGTGPVPRSNGERSLCEFLDRWRFRWLPYRTHQSLGDGRFTQPKWQWPEVFNRGLR